MKRNLAKPGEKVTESLVCDSLDYDDLPSEVKEEDMTHSVLVVWLAGQPQLYGHHVVMCTF